MGAAWCRHLYTSTATLVNCLGHITVDVHSGCLRGMVWTIERLDDWKKTMIICAFAESGIDDLLDDLGQ